MFFLAKRFNAPARRSISLNFGAHAPPCGGPEHGSLKPQGLFAAIVALWKW
jgi:hypothetical protein